MSADDHVTKSAWNFEADSDGNIRRVRDTSVKTGVPTLPLESKLRTLFMGIAGVAEMLGDKFSADAVENKAEELAYGWALLAQENERVRIVVKFLVETTALSEAIAPTVIVGGAIAWHYNLIPDKVGVPMATIAGAVPLSREQEVELRRRAEAELKQQEAAAEAADQYENENEPEPSEAEPSPINKGTPQVVPLPSDADIGPST